VPSFDAELATRLSQRKHQGLYRTRRIKDSPEGPEIEIEGHRYINFSSNDYLGLANDIRVREAFVRGLQQYGVGSGASHLITGHCRAHHELEQALAAFTDRPRALIFSTGYMANLGVLSALVNRADSIFADRANHASLIDAALLSGAKWRRYPHGDVERLASLLKLPREGRAYVLTDGVFSMDGDFAPLRHIAEICAEHDAVLVVDDAHGFGILGQDGRGSLEHFRLDLDDVPVLMATFGKALGVHGAFVAGSEALIKSLIQHARTYIYTTAMPPAMAVATQESLSIVQTEGWRREKLFSLIQYLQDGARQRNIAFKGSPTAIQPFIIGDSYEAVRASEFLQERGLYVVPIRPPTVPEGTARLRVSLSAAHGKEHIDQLLDALADFQ
jgi:8-amino-7-oxononanoate synthase